MWPLVQHWLAVHTGSVNMPGVAPGNAFWGGCGSDLGEITILGGLIAIYKKHVCHTRWCWRFGHHDFTDNATGLVWKLCRKCHPLHPGHSLTKHRVAQIHEANGQREGS